jgi:hypothetical protein
MIPMEELTWPCMVCGDERPDAVIAVAKRDLPPRLGGANWPVGFSAPQFNVRYCTDRPDRVAYATAEGPWRGGRRANG